jgi:hypothetical protein
MQKYRILLAVTGYSVKRRGNTTATRRPREPRPSFFGPRVFYGSGCTIVAGFAGGHGESRLYFLRSVVLSDDANRQHDMRSSLYPVHLSA